MAYNARARGRAYHSVKQYEDLNGNIPEEGDTPDMFTWSGDTVWTKESWADHVAAAVEATERAQSELDEWRSHDLPPY